jgi:hypothetical protein
VVDVGTAVGSVALGDALAGVIAVAAAAGVASAVTVGDGLDKPSAVDAGVACACGVAPAVSGREGVGPAVHALAAIAIRRPAKERRIAPRTIAAARSPTPPARNERSAS